MVDDLTKIATISAVLTLGFLGIAVLFNVIKSCFWAKKGDKLKEAKEYLVDSLCVIPGIFFLWFAVLSPATISKKYGLLIGIPTGVCLVGLGILIIVYSLRIGVYFCKHKKGERAEE
jgi:predicted transporter